MAVMHPPEYCINCGEVVSRATQKRPSWQEPLIGDDSYVDWKNHKCSRSGIRKMNKKFKENKELQKTIKKAKEKLLKMIGDKEND